MSLVIPEKAGTQDKRLQCQIFAKVTPLRILRFDQFELPSASPFLDPLFPKDCIGHRFVKLDENQPIYPVLSNEPADDV